jgi:hypothetical protein
MHVEQGGRGCASIGRGLPLRQIFMSGQFDSFVVSSRALSRLIEVDSTWGGSMGRNVSLDMGGGSLLVVVQWYVGVSPPAPAES